jgi:heme exporter protein D
VNVGEGSGLISGFLAMGGHGLYVWLSYGAGVAVVAYNVLSVRWRERRWVREYLDRQRRHSAAARPVGSNQGVAEP